MYSELSLSGTTTHRHMGSTSSLHHQNKKDQEGKRIGQKSDQIDRMEKTSFFLEGWDGTKIG
jgi:hypothetical protein